MKNFLNIKTNVLIASSLVGLTIACANTASAENSMTDGVRYYAGMGVGYNNYGLHGEFKKVLENTNKCSVSKSSADFLIPILGIKFKDHFGAEFGYAFHKKLKVSGNNGGILRVRNSFIDIIGYMPVGASSFDLIGGLGLGRMSITAKGLSAQAALGAKNYNKFGFRAKFGGQHTFSDGNVVVRGLVGYQQVGSKAKKQAFRNSQSANLDLLYLI